jgi:putative addiction module component (TIGR02574 family)
MPSIDFKHLSTLERIELIGDLCDSLEDAAMPLTPEQEAELDRRIAMLDTDMEHARRADAVLAEFRRRHR